MSRRRMMLATIGSAGPVTAYWRPVATTGLSGSNGTYAQPYSLNLHLVTDEETPSDSDYILMTNGSRFGEMRLGGPAPGPIGTATFSFRAKSGFTTISLTVQLGSVIRTISINSSMATRTFTINAAEAAGWNLDDLRVRFTKNVQDELRISWVELLINPPI